MTVSEQVAIPDKPLCIDLFCGLGGWSEAFLAEGYECRGYDIEAHDYGSGGYPGTLILRDVRSIHGSEFKDAAVIVGSSPCQEFSYRAMPWSRAKALGPPYLGMELFNAQFRIQREASEAAGRHIPMVVENVRGAQKWVGRAQWHYGSFYLWGDVPALMPMTFKGTKHDDSGWRENGTLQSSNRMVQSGPRCTCPTECDCQNPEPKDGGFALISEECPIHNWNERPSLTCPLHGEHVAAGIKTVGHANIRDGHTHTRHLTNQRESDGLKRPGQTISKGFNNWPKDEYGEYILPDGTTLSQRDGVKQLGISGVRENPLVVVRLVSIVCGLHTLDAYCR
jgi:hypothetical protein